MNDKDDAEAARRLIDRAFAQVDEGQPSLALQTIYPIWKQKLPVRDLHLVIGLAHAKLHQYGDACEELRNELRNFPDNELAATLLDDLQPFAPRK